MTGRGSEYADLASRDSPEMLFDLMGFGHSTAEFPPERFAFAAYSFGPSILSPSRPVTRPSPPHNWPGKIKTVMLNVPLLRPSATASLGCGRRRRFAPTYPFRLRTQPSRHKIK